MTTIADLPKTAATMPTITVYGPPQCPNCDRATTLLARKGVAHTKVDIEAGDAHHRYVTEELGYAAAPVITVELDHRTVHWGGHRMDLLMALSRLCTTGIALAEVAS